MFGLFKKKTEAEKFNEKYKKLLAEAHQLSSSTRKASDVKQYEAEQVLKTITLLST